MAHLNNLPRRKKILSFISFLGNKVKSALEYGAAAKGLFGMGRGIYQGISTYGPMVYNGFKAIGPTAAAAAAVL